MIINKNSQMILQILSLLSLNGLRIRDRRMKITDKLSNVMI